MMDLNHAESFRDLLVYLTEVDAEQMETQHWLGEACNCHYVDPKQARELTEELLQISRMLNSMMDKAHSFCRRNHSLACEDGSEYMVETVD